MDEWIYKCKKIVSSVPLWMYAIEIISGEVRLTFMDNLKCICMDECVKYGCCHVCTYNFCQIIDEKCQFS